MPGRDTSARRLSLWLRALATGRTRRPPPHPRRRPGSDGAAPADPAPKPTPFVGGATVAPD